MQLHQRHKGTHRRSLPRGVLVMNSEAERLAAEEAKVVWERLSHWIVGEEHDFDTINDLAGLLANAAWRLAS